MSAFENRDRQIAEKEPAAKRSSPLRARGRFSSMTPYNGRTGVVQFINRSDGGNAYAMVNFERSVAGRNDWKAIPLSAFPYGYVQTNDSVTVYVGEDREGDRRNLARRVLEAIGVLKESTKTHAVINVHASEQGPDQDVALDPPRHATEAGILTRLAEKIDSAISLLAASVSAVFKTVSKLSRQATVPLPAEQHVEEVRLPAQTPGIAGLVEVDPKDVTLPAGKDNAIAPRSNAQHAPLHAPVGQRIEIQRSKAPQPQPIQYEIPIIEKPQAAVRVAGTSQMHQPQSISVSSSAPKRYFAQHDVMMPKPQNAQLFAQIPQAQSHRVPEVTRPSEAIVTESPFKTEKQNATRTLKIPPKARAQAALSPSEVRAVAMEQARKHREAEKTQEQGKAR